MMDGGDNGLYEIRRRFHSVEQCGVVGSSLSNNATTAAAAVANVDAKDVDEDDNKSEDTAATDVDSEESSTSGSGGGGGGPANICPETGELLESIPSPAADLGEASSSVNPTLSRPKNTISLSSFIQSVSSPNEELGHGGYLPQELARWTFLACANRAEEEIDHLNKSGSLWGEHNKEKKEEVAYKSALVKTKKGGGECYWTMYDVLSFGCEAVRYDAVARDAQDNNDSEALRGIFESHAQYKKYASELPLLRVAYKTFCQLPRQEEGADGQHNNMVMTRSQIGRMLLLLLEHESYRLEADSPPISNDEDNSDKAHTKSRKPWSNPNEQSGGVELLDNDEYLASLKNESDVRCEYSLATLVDASYASLLGLLPSNLDLSQFDSGPGTDKKDEESSHSIPLSVLVDYVIAEATNKQDDHRSPATTIGLAGFVKWHLHFDTTPTGSTNGRNNSNTGVSAMSIYESRLGPYLLDLRLITSVLFGVRPASAPMEQLLIEEIQRRHKYRYPRTRGGTSVGGTVQQSVLQPSGPNGTVWYVLDAEWWRTWKHFTEAKVGLDGTATVDFGGGSYRMGKIDNNRLLSTEGILLSLKQNLHWHRDFELVEPLAWSALQAWHDGGPPIARSVVPVHKEIVGGGGAKSEEYEIELYPLYATVFLCDKSSKGEPRPFQQFIPLSRYLPLAEMVNKLREGLGRDARLRRYDCRLWLLDSDKSSSTSGKDDDSLGWLLDLDLTIGDERNLRGVSLDKEDQHQNISLMLELRNEDGTWPRSQINMLGKDEADAGGQDGEDEDKDEVALGDGIVGLYNMG